MSLCSQLFLRGLARLGEEYQPAPERLVLLELYFAELMKWRQKMNLIGKMATEEEVIEKHFLDSLSLLPEFDQDSRLLDIGTGAGFPGLVCKTVLPALAVDLVEPRLKRVHFLRHIARKLGLNDDEGHVTIHTDRMTINSPLCLEEFDFITCRGVAEITSFLELVSCFSSSGARLLLMKGPKWEEEWREAESVHCLLRYRLERVREVTLPFSQAKRFVLVIVQEH